MLSQRNLSYSPVLENKSTWNFLAKSLISVTLDLKQNNSTFQLFALLVMKDYVDLFVTDYDNFVISLFFSKIKTRPENNTYWETA